ncbi:ClpP/crotonase-like domain-containing protein [Exophiala viscosa]|uniref:ClpP/crotonase-like domain-containing protein n=1 Tax=Exophiala viscosa TaxID=2486360 RepID=A0AAN6E5B4_9EURO|nr:ClpP/crotonase-like domain-containing protein [Exophiala viscosa]
MSPPPELGTVTIQLSNGVALLKFNRPKAGNALNRQAFKDMLAALQWASSSPDVRVIVQSGEGKFFTAGMDLMDGVYEDPSTVLPDEAITTLHAYHKTLILTDKVLIAAVNGPAVGYGTSSIALFDLVYAIPEAFFFTPFVKWGLSAEACSSFTFSHILGRQKASALILADERMTAADLERAGLITKIIPAEKLMSEVTQLAGRIAKLPPDSLRFNKKLLMRPYRKKLLEANKVELAGLKKRARTQEAKDAIRAFAEQQESKKKTRAKL